MATSKKEQEAYNEARWRIEAFLNNEESNNDYLDLSDLGLAILPPELSELTALVTLDLSGNQLTELPLELSKLNALAALDLSNNQFTSLSSEIGKITNLITLDLSSNQITSLPPEIGKLTKLITLSLSGNQITSLPPEICKLTKLDELNLYDNQITSLPSEIGNLTALTTLEIIQNQLVSLPSEIGKLAKLTSLYLSGNQLINLPLEISNLTALTTLYLSSNQLVNLPPGIGYLTQLTGLSISANQLTSLPPEIGKITNLITLNISGNQITSLPPEISKLTKLITLNISGNQLTSLPPEISKLTKLRTLDLADNQLTSLPHEMLQLFTLNELYLHFNIGLGIPDSILGPSLAQVRFGAKKTRKTPVRPADILNFYFARLTEQVSLPKVRELKMMLVGRGGAGKTSLRRFFLNQPHDQDEQETPGIALDSFPLNCKDTEMTVRLWDFAGQEITHALHQFFLTEGCVYVLVLDPRSNTETKDAEYWLELLQRYACGAPVVVALNRQDARQGGYDVDRHGLKERFPFVRDFILTNCQTRSGCEHLLEAVCSVINGLKNNEPPHLQIPPAWLEVMRECRAQKDRQHLTLAEFGAICARHGEKDSAKQESLARLLHQLGVVLHFVDEPRLRDTSVLDPHWVTNGVYRLLRFKDRPMSDGTLTVAEACEALPEETEKAVRFLLRLMERFEMCFPLDEEVSSVPTRWLIPGALDPYQPQGIGPGWQEPGSVRMRYVYDPLPEGVIPRFIVQTHLLSEGQARWRNGVVLVEGRAQALVRRGEKPNHVEITAFGPEAERLRLLEIIQGSFERINADVPGSPPVAELELEGLPGVYRSIADLEAAEQIEQPVVVAVPPDNARVEPTPQLNRTSEKADRDPDKVPLNAFLSYAHEDKRSKDVFQNNLTVLMKKRYITPWHDGLIEPGMRWQEEIEENLEKMDVFIGLLTTAFLVSDFIEKVEIKAARERLKKQDRDFVFLLILVDDISLQNLDLAEYQVLKPGGKAVTQHASRKAGFDLAQKELENLLATRQTAKKEKTRKGAASELPRERLEAVSEGVTIIVKGDYIHGHKPMSTNSHNIIVHGNITNSQVGQTLTNCSQRIRQQAPGELKTLLEELRQNMEQVIAKLPEDKQEEAAENLEMLTKAATAATPNRKWYSVSSEGLLEAANYVKEFSGSVTTTIRNLTKLLEF